MTLKINVDEMVKFMVGLLNTPSPTGDTIQGITYIQEKFAELPFESTISPKGLLSGTWTGQASNKPRGVTAHVDTLGAMVQRVKKNGRLMLTQLGSYHWRSVEGEGVTILTRSGQTFRGTILPIEASIHAHTSKARNALRTNSNMEVRIDAHTDRKLETLALGINIGDIIAFDPRVELNPNGYIRSRHLDDKSGVAVIYGALKAIAEAGLQPAQTSTIHISNFEEVGHGAATGFPADLAELLTIDMAVVGPDQASDETAVTICVKDSAGPYDIQFRHELQTLAESNSIDYQLDVYPYYGSDGEAYWRAGGNVRVALIGPGVDASHHYERTHRDGLEQTARLIAAYLLS